MLPQARQYETARGVTNPYQVSLDGVVLLGTSGEPISDIERYVATEDRLELLISTLVWRHLAPTAPDTLPCYPYDDRDPFVMQALPHVYFAGNQPSFATALVDSADGRRTRVITLPSFSDTGELVLLDLATLKCHAVAFTHDM